MTVWMVRQYSEARPRFGTVKMPFRCITHSLTGARACNEDTVLTFVLGQDRFAILCDGLGGYPDGDWASNTFAHTLQDTITRHLPADETPPRQALEDWLQRAWQRFVQQREQQQRHEQAQTTFALVWLAADFTLAAHAGDSRIYRLDARQVCWRSRDHTLYELGILNGDIDPVATPVPQGQQALLYRSVSSQKPLKPTITEQPALTVGEGVLLCSDGAWLHVSDGEWCTLLTQPDTLPVLLQRAVERGGDKADNTSAALVIRSA